MKVLSIIITIGVLIVYAGCNLLADVTGYSYRAMFYMLMGAWSAVLSLCLMLFIFFSSHSIWRSIALFALFGSSIEGMQMTVCRALVDDINNIPSGMNLCDYLTGLPIGSTIIGLYITIASYIVGRQLKK